MKIRLNKRRPRTVGKSLMLASSEFIHLEVLTGGIRPYGRAGVLVPAARRLVDAGLAGILVLPPFYYKPVTDDGLFAFFAKLVDSLAPSETKIYLYSFPQLTGLKLSLDLIVRLAQAFPDRIVGLKDSSGDIDFSRRIVQALPDFRVFPSTEAILSEARVAGFAGCISATENITCQLAGQVWRAQSETDDGKQAHLISLRQVISKYPLVPAVKYLVAHRNRNEAWRSVLAPLIPLTAAQGEGLLSDLESANWK